MEELRAALTRAKQEIKTQTEYVRVISEKGAEAYKTALRRVAQTRGEQAAAVCQQVEGVAKQIIDGLAVEESLHGRPQGPSGQPTNP